MNVQNHRDIILKCHLTITHGTANITYLSPSVTPRQSQNYLKRKWRSTFEKGFIFKIFLVNEGER